MISDLPFPLEDAEIYEPPRDDDRGTSFPKCQASADKSAEETLDEVTNRVVSSLPRVQAIEALHGFQTMKSVFPISVALIALMNIRDRLKTMLAVHAEAGHTISKEDIETFFTELREGGAH